MMSVLIAIGFLIGVVAMAVFAVWFGCKLIDNDRNGR